MITPTAPSPDPTLDVAPDPASRPPPRGPRRLMDIVASSITSPVLLMLLVIILVAGPLRFLGLDWDSGAHLHPDERFITMVSNGIELPKGLGDYFDTARSPLNPYNRNFGSYIYGTLPLFFVRALAEGIQTFARAVPG